MKRAKITKERTIQALDKEIISLDDHEREIDSIKDSVKRTGDVFHFVKLSQLKLKIRDQKLKVLSSKINLINTPTIDTVINLDEKNEQ